MRKEMLSSKNHAVMTRLHVLILELIQILHRSVVHDVSGQDDHEVVSMIRQSLELRIEFHEIHAAER